MSMFKMDISHNVLITTFYELYNSEKYNIFF